MVSILALSSLYHILQVIVGDESHIFQYEAAGVSVLGGVGMHTVPTADNGELPLKALNKAVRLAKLAISPIPSAAAMFLEMELSW